MNYCSIINNTIPSPTVLFLSPQSGSITPNYCFIDIIDDQTIGSWTIKNLISNSFKNDISKIHINFILYNNIQIICSNQEITFKPKSCLKLDFIM
jgi:hypothetical protein